MQHGACPLCATPGVVGRPCQQSVCLRRGYHVVPVGSGPRDGAAGRLTDPLIGLRVGSHLVIDRLGHGGMGAVYLGLDEHIGQQVAIKVLGAEADGPEEATEQEAVTRRERFRKEAEALARLSHPNIVRLVAFGTHEDIPYLAMEFVRDGRTLAAEMKAGLAEDDARRVLVQLSYALEAAHAQGIVHRDIKPANVMLQSTPDESHFVRLVDFGLAKFVDDGHKTRLVAGTPVYMAPEQVTRGRIGAWTDIYAMGVLTFELLTGTRLFGDRKGLELMRWKCDRENSPLDDLPPAAVSAAMRRFLSRTLAFEPSARITSTAEFRAALDALRADDSEIAASQPPPAFFVSPKPRRRRRPARRLALVAGLAAAGLALALLRAGAPTAEPPTTRSVGFEVKPTAVAPPGLPGFAQRVAAPQPGGEPESRAEESPAPREATVAEPNAERAPAPPSGEVEPAPAPPARPIRSAPPSPPSRPPSTADHAQRGPRPASADRPRSGPSATPPAEERRAPAQRRDEPAPAEAASPDRSLEDIDFGEYWE